MSGQISDFNTNDLRIEFFFIFQEPDFKKLKMKSARIIEIYKEEYLYAFTPLLLSITNQPKQVNLYLFLHYHCTRK